MRDKLLEIEKELDRVRIYESKRGVKALDRVKKCLSELSKEFDKLLDTNSRKLSRKIERRLKYIRTTDGVDEEEQECLLESLDECFELINEQVEKALEQYKEEEKPGLTEQEVLNIRNKLKKVKSL